MKFIQFRAEWQLTEGDQVAPICEGRIMLKKSNGKIGIWDFDGNNIIPEEDASKCECISFENPIYEFFKSIKHIKYVFIFTKANEKFVIYSYEGKQFECGEIDEYEIFRKTMIVNQSGKKGVISLETGKSIIPIEFEQIENKYHDIYTEKYGEIYKVHKNGKCGCYFEKYGCIFSAEYDDWNWRQQEECIDVTKDGLYGIYNFRGKEIVPINFLPEITTVLKVVNQSMNVPKSKIYIVKSTDKKYGVYSEEGKEIVPVKYDSIETNKDLVGFPFITKVDNLYGLYNLDGKKLLENKYELISTYELICSYKDNSRFLLVKDNGLFGLYLVDTRELIEPQFNEVEWDSEYGLYVKKGELYGLYSKRGKCILKAEYIKITKESIYNIPECRWGAYLKLYANNGLYGFYHRRTLYEPQYQQVDTLEYSETDLLLVKNGLYGIYSSSGKIILKPECEKLELIRSNEYLVKHIKEQPKVYVFKKEQLYGFYFYGRTKKLIEPQFTSYDYFISRKEPWACRIIGENDEIKVVYNKNGFITN